MSAEYTPAQLVKRIEEFFTFDAGDAKDAENALENIRTNYTEMYADNFKVDLVNQQNIIHLLKTIADCFYHLKKEFELGDSKHLLYERWGRLFLFDDLMHGKIYKWVMGAKLKNNTEIGIFLDIKNRSVQAIDRKKGFDVHFAKFICKRLVSFCLDPGVERNETLGQDELLIIQLFQMRFNLGLYNNDIIPDNLADDIKELARESLKSKVREDITLTPEQLAQVKFAKQIDDKILQLFASIPASEVSKNIRKISAILEEVRERDPIVLNSHDASQFCKYLLRHCWGHDGTLTKGQNEAGVLERSIIKLLFQNFQHILNFESIIQHSRYENVREKMLEWYDEASPRQETPAKVVEILKLYFTIHSGEAQKALETIQANSTEEYAEISKQVNKMIQNEYKEHAFVHELLGLTGRISTSFVVLARHLTPEDADYEENFKMYQNYQRLFKFEILIERQIMKWLDLAEPTESNRNTETIRYTLRDVRSRSEHAITHDDAQLLCKCLLAHCWGVDYDSRVKVDIDRLNGFSNTKNKPLLALERQIIRVLLGKFASLEFKSILPSGMNAGLRFDAENDYFDGENLASWYRKNGVSQEHQARRSNAMMVDACAGMQCQNACWFDVQIHGLRAQICGHPRERQCLQVLELFRQYYNCQMHKLDNNDERQLFTLVWNSLSCVCETPVTVHPVQCPQQFAYMYIHRPRT